MWNSLAPLIACAHKFLPTPPVFPLEHKNESPIFRNFEKGGRERSQPITYASPNFIATCSFLCVRCRNGNRMMPGTPISLLQLFFNFLFCLGLGEKRACHLYYLCYPTSPSPLSFPDFFPIFFVVLCILFLFAEELSAWFAGWGTRTKCSIEKIQKNDQSLPKRYWRSIDSFRNNNKKKRKKSKHFLTSETRKKNSFLFPPPLIVVVVSPLLSWLVFSYAPSFLPHQNGKRGRKRVVNSGITIFPRFFFRVKKHSLTRIPPHWS